MNVKNIFFDLDHTLWDFERNSACTFKLLFKNHNVNVDLDRFLDIYIPINLHYWKLYRNESISKEYLRYNRLNEAFSKLKLSIPSILINQLSNDYIETLPKFNYLIDGALDLLEYLKPKYKLYILTNGFKNVQANKLNNAGISSYFNQVFDSESVGVKKPNPIIFKYALDNSKSKADDSLMIGDSFEADIMGALSIGMHAIHYANFGEKPHDKCLIINKLKTLKKIL